MQQRHSASTSTGSVSHVPATALPWARKTANNGDVDLVSGVKFVATFGAADGDLVDAIKQDADYAEHACNAYPRLVEALKEALKWVDENDPGSGSRLYLRCADLLRELGELGSTAVSVGDAQENEKAK